MSEDPKQEFFSDGLTEEIITALSKVPQLFVIARNSTFTYKGKPVKVQQVSEELGVRYVLEGSVRKDWGQYTNNSPVDRRSYGESFMGGTLRPKYERHICRSRRDHKKNHHGHAGTADGGGTSPNSCNGHKEP